MRLIDEDQLREQQMKYKKTRRIIISFIIILILLSIAIIALIIYLQQHPSKIRVYIDGQENANFVNFLDVRIDEYGKEQVYMPIKESATYFGYQSFSGEYNSGFEDNKKCHVIKEDREVAMFELGSKTIYKLNLEENTTDYEYCYSDQSVYENNGMLYTSIDGMSQGFNLDISYDEQKKILQIYTIDTLLEAYKTNLENVQIADYGIVEIEEDNFTNLKAIFDGMLVIKTENGKSGVISIPDYSVVLEPKYDEIRYIPQTSDFFITTNGKVGIISKERKTKVKADYDSLSLIDRDNNLYMASKGNLYGVINDQEKEIIHLENEQIGIDISDYSYNGIKNGNVLLGKLIPVKQDDLWAFYDITGKMVTDGYIYDSIGCKVSNKANVYNLLAIQDYNVIIVKSNDKYTFMDINGNDEILPLVFDEIFIRVSEGKDLYEMIYNDKTYDVLDYLVRRGVKSVNDSK